MVSVASVSREITFGGYRLTRIGLGTNRLTDTPEHRSFLKAAVDVGVNFIDTAHLYSGGESERTIGAALPQSTDDLVVATKGGYHAGGGRPERLRAELEESFERLRTATIALYYLHRVDPEVPLEETLGLLKEFTDAGRIEHVGICQVSVEQVERARTVLPIAAVQNEYSLSERKYDDVVDFCEREDLQFVPFYPLRGGGPPALREIAGRYDASPQQILLAWLLKRSPAIVPIPGTLSLEHLKENLAVLDIDLSDADYDELSSA
jgi:pyridoxine 4-dehydrogenase